MFIDFAVVSKIEAFRRMAREEDLRDALVASKTYIARHE
jgi:hypothetical protein